MVSHQRFKRFIISMEDGAEISTWDSDSSGLPVVFVHGFPENHHCWDKVFNCFPKEVWQNYRIICYDLRGFGESSKLGEASPLRFYYDHLTVLQSLGIEQYHLVGHDWGGAVALHVARYQPQSLLSLTVMNTNYWKTDIKGMWHMIVLSLPFIPHILLRFWPEKFFNFAMKKAFYDHNHLSDVAHHYLPIFKDRSATRYWVKLYRNMAKMLMTQVIPGLKKIIKVSRLAKPKNAENAFQVKTKIIWGRDDTFNPIWIANDMVERLTKYEADVVLHSLENAGHFVQEEQANQVADLLVKQWVKQ